MSTITEIDPLELIPTLPQEPLTKRETLLEAADTIEQFGWLQNDHGNVLMGFCLAGSVLKVMGIGVEDGIGMKRVLELLGGPGLTDHVCKNWRQAAWNDEPGRTKEEVVTALRRLADGATWAEAIA